MPIPTPFHPRTSALCASQRWKQWAGYYAVCSYDTTHEREYFAFRHCAGLLDVTPLYKYEVTGQDAAAFLAWVMAKDIRKLKLGQVAYVCWCDERGHVVDDGTVTRLDGERYRMTSAEPNLAWLERLSRGFRVRIEDVSQKIAALALQGPNSREILKKISDADMDSLGFFRAAGARVEGFDATITRTGYTGDLGYEIWVDSRRALPLWDAVMEGGRPYGIEPAGLDALDVTRIEAGFILLDVDYFSARGCLIESRKSTPYEIGLGWTVDLDREPFLGQQALKTAKDRPGKSFVGLEIDWEELETLYDRVGLPPQLPMAVWRTPVPVYDDAQIGQATSGVWSPTLKKNLALATIAPQYAAVGSEVKIEATVEYVRHQVTARVAQRPFFNPERKRSLPKKEEEPKGRPVASLL